MDVTVDVTLTEEEWSELIEILKDLDPITDPIADSVVKKIQKQFEDQTTSLAVAIEYMRESERSTARAALHSEAKLLAMNRVLDKFKR